MLLLILSLFSNYCLFHCNPVREAYYNQTQLSAQMRRSIREIDTLLGYFQQEIQKQKSALRTVDLEDYLKDVGLLDYSITSVWWDGITGVDQEGHKTPATTFLPTPVGHGMTNSSKHKDSQHTKSLWEHLNHLTSIRLNYPTGLLDVVPIPGHLPEHPDYPLELKPYKPFTFPTSPIVHPVDPYYLTFYLTKATSNYFTRPASPSSEPPRTAPGTLPAYPPVPALDRDAIDQHYLPGSPSTWIGSLKPVHPTRPPNDTDILTTTPADTRPSSASETTTRVSILSPSPLLSLPDLIPITSNPKMSFISNFFTIAKRMKVRTDFIPNKRITKANRITPLTHQSRLIGRTLSKAQAWVRNRQWMKSSKARRTTDRNTKEGLRTAEPEIRPPGHEERTETAVAAELLKEDAQGFLNVTVPASILSEYVASPPTAAGKVLHYARNFARPSLAAVHPNKEYHDMMDEWDEGYMMVFLIQLSQLVSVKRENELADVLQHAELIMNRFKETGELAWVGDRIMKVATYICRFCSEAGTQNKAALRSYAVMFHQMLRERDTAMSIETNSIIHYADLMYEDDEGEALFDALREFEKYPNPNVRKTSREICLSLMQTFLRPFRRLRMTGRCQRLMDSVNRALTQRLRFGNRRKNGELTMLGGTATAKQNYSKARKRIYISLKQRMNIKRHLINRTKHRSEQIIRAAEHPNLRSMLPITRHKKRFRVITPRQLRSNAYLNIDRPTKEYFYKRRLGIPIHPLNEMLQFFPQTTKELEIKRRMQPTGGRQDNF